MHSVAQFSLVIEGSSAYWPKIVTELIETKKPYIEQKFQQPKEQNISLIYLFVAINISFFEAVNNSYFDTIQKPYHSL